MLPNPSSTAPLSQTLMGMHTRAVYSDAFVLDRRGPDHPRKRAPLAQRVRRSVLILDADGMWTNAKSFAATLMSSWGPTRANERVSQLVLYAASRWAALRPIEQARETHRAELIVVAATTARADAAFAGNLVFAVPGKTLVVHVGLACDAVAAVADAMGVATIAFPSPTLATQPTTPSAETRCNHANATFAVDANGLTSLVRREFFRDEDGAAPTTAAKPVEEITSDDEGDASYDDDADANAAETNANPPAP